MEMMNDPTRKIGRPRQLYVGEVLREYQDIEEREEVEKVRFDKPKREANVMSLPVL